LIQGPYSHGLFLIFGAKIDEIFSGKFAKYHAIQKNFSTNMLTNILGNQHHFRRV